MVGVVGGAEAAVERIADHAATWRPVGAVHPKVWMVLREELAELAIRHPGFYDRIGQLLVNLQYLVEPLQMQHDRVVGRWRGRAVSPIATSTARPQRHASAPRRPNDLRDLFWGARIYYAADAFGIWGRRSGQGVVAPSYVVGPDNAGKLAESLANSIGIAG
jgi:hypothetical protein